MIIWRAAEQDQVRLIRMPESGMGYQIIWVRIKQMHYLVLNATFVASLGELRESGFSREDLPYLSGDPDGRRALELRAHDSLGHIELAFTAFGGRAESRMPGAEVQRSVAFPVPTRRGRNRLRSFYRFSAYTKDKHVDANGFKRGTYATTYSDIRLVPSGFAAVGRYALPNPASANCVFQILTRATPTLVGATSPNFGQAGGGVEVRFDNGAANEVGVGFTISSD
jgi:hypothetical protein